jgi:hypothetical protein
MDGVAERREAREAGEFGAPCIDIPTEEESVLSLLAWSIVVRTGNKREKRSET